jgi:hypothetical protein
MLVGSCIADAYACDRERELTMLVCGMCASATRSLRYAIDETRIDIAYRYMMHACIYPLLSLLRLATQMNGSPMRARRTHAPTCCVRACARVCVRLGAHASAPTRASPSRRRRLRVPRLAGVPVCVGVQRRHRRVEHRACHRVVRGMRRLSGPGGAQLRAGRARPGRRCGAGRCARRHRRSARVCVQTCGHAHARVCTCVSLRVRKMGTPMYVFMYFYMYMYIY